MPIINTIKSILGHIGFFVAQFFRFFPLNGMPHKFVVFFQRFNPSGRKQDFPAGNGYLLTKETNNLLYISGLHEYQLLKFIHRRLNDHETFIDIGANTGMSILWLHHQHPFKKIHFIAFEPMPGNVAILKKNLSLNPDISCTVFPVALGPKNEMQNFSTAGDGDGSARKETLVKQGQISNREIIPVEVKTLDFITQNYEIPNPSVILIDVEGFAGEVLYGARNFFSIYRPTVIVEIHDEEEHQKVENFLQSYDYLLVSRIKKYGLHLVFESRK